MKRILFSTLLLILGLPAVRAQLLTWTPEFANGTGNITITLDATKGNQGLQGFAGNVYVHIGVITNLSTSSSDWKHVPFTWGTTPAAAQANPAGTNKWSYTINNINTFFSLAVGESIQQIAILFRDGTGNTVHRNTDGSDMYVPLYDNGLNVRLNQPPFEPKFIRVPEPINKNVGESISAVGVASQVSDMKLIWNGNDIQSASGVSTISASPVITTAGTQELIVEAVAGAVTRRDTLRFFVGPSSPTIAPLPAGVQDGINYESGDTSVIFVLYAPNKSRVSVIGEFPGSNWLEQVQYLMNRTPDGNRWWVRVTGLTPGTEYAFQYLVNGSLKTTDPYCEKILDPWNDGFISATTYPALKAYPTATSGIVGVVQTGQPNYNWAINNFNRPDKRNLIIYECLLRDLLAAHDWKTLSDTLSYFKNLGINAIQLMPINEFEGNLSWGYNPDFFLAPDKYYGPKNDLKRFIDSAHSKGIAVLMDIALNHTTGLNPLAALYWDGANNRPAADNPWLNPVARHPFNVFNDFNHESAQTKYFFKRVTEHWLVNYKIDGFRFDLSKGFTQVNSGNDVGAWSNYDASRVAIWKSYYDTLMSRSNGSYVILEHFAANNEEKELSDYGMLLWGNLNYNFSEAAKGVIANSNFDGALHVNRGWTNPYLVSYMESHDEERVMYRLLNEGLSQGTYNTRDLNTALKRSELAAAFLFTMPGPKMLWQFGEMGYDFPINYCVNGTVNNDCRLDPKPIRWDYLQNTNRKSLQTVYSKLFALRQHPSYKNSFTGGTIERSLNGAFKWMKVNTDTARLLVVGNFDLIPQAAQVTFPEAGTWWDYLDNNSIISATGSAQTITLQPGEFHVYLNRNLNNVATTPTSNLYYNGNPIQIRVYPNPAVADLFAQVNIPEAGKVEIDMLNVNGQFIQLLESRFMAKGEYVLPLNLNQKPAAGNYIIRIRTGLYSNFVKFVIQ